MNIHSKEQWATITNKTIRDHGGIGLLFYHSTLFNALKALYPNEDWSFLPIRAKKNYQPPLSEDDQRKLADRIAETYGITNPVDWRIVTNQQFKALGGGYLINKYSSLFNTLCALYPEHNWREILPRRNLNNWKTTESQREFLDKIAAKYSLNNVEDWCSLSVKTIKQEGGLSLLRKHGSMFAMLRAVYPERDWNVFLERKKTNSNYWNDPENIRSFLELIKQRFSIENDTNWYYITSEQFRSVYGGNALLTKYGNLVNILRIAYPDQIWEFGYSEHTGSVFEWLIPLIEDIFPGKTLQREFIMDINGDSYCYDVYLPELGLAIDYHGIHHYQELASSDSLELLQKRDQVKLCSSKQAGVKLVVMPYWVEHSAESLTKRIIESHPSLLQHVLQGNFGSNTQ